MSRYSEASDSRTDITYATQRQKVVGAEHAALERLWKAADAMGAEPTAGEWDELRRWRDVLRPLFGEDEKR